MDSCLNWILQGQRGKPKVKPGPGPTQKNLTKFLARGDSLCSVLDFTRLLHPGYAGVLLKISRLGSTQPYSTLPVLLNQLVSAEVRL